MVKNEAAASQDPLETVSAETAVRSAGYVMPHPHCHTCFELFYVESGTCRFFIENRLYDIHAGDFMLIPPEIFHYTRYLSGQCRRHVVHFRRTDLEDRVIGLLPGREEFLTATRILQMPEEYRGQMSAHFTKMVNEKRLRDRRSQPMLHALLQELFLLCDRECRLLNGIPEEIHTTDSQILQAARFISEHYMERVTAADIAAAAGYSPNYLSRKFRSAVGIGVHEYLMFIRLRHAACELLTTDDRITDVAFRCGFSDSNYFKDAFKKKYGVTPGAYRRKP